MNNNLSFFERAALAVSAAAKKYALPVAASLVFGFMAHMYAFTNKLLNADETAALFSKGATLTSGRWGLELTKLVFPDVSMPWIYGVISLLLVTAAVCFIISAFGINKKLTQVLLCGAVMAFPAMTGNFCYMFTSASYSLAIFMAVLAVYLFTQGGKVKCTAGCIALAFTLGIYQAYISLAASFCVVLLIKELMADDASPKAVLLRGVKLLGMLALSLALYFLITLIVESVLGTGYQEYDTGTKTGLLRGLLTVYSSFVGIFTSGNFGFVNSGISIAAHIICVLAILCALVHRMAARHDRYESLLMLALVIIYPLSVNCMYLAASPDIIHSLVMFGFVSFYVLTTVCFDALDRRIWLLRDLTAIASAVIIFANVFFANEVYLKMYLEYENAYSFYNSLMAEVMDTPGFSQFTVIDIVGNTQSGLTHFDEEIDTAGFTGPNEDLVNTYTRVSFIKYYLGLDLYMYREDTILDCDWYDEMPCYPADGSIKYLEDEDRIVVKLG